jgi:probable HAF family extracellular repeat protein
VGSYQDAAGSHGFLLSGGTVSPIDVPGAATGTTSADGINAVGQIVGSYVDATGLHGFLHSGGTFTTIDVPGAAGGGTRAYRISATGQIAGSFTDAKNVVHGFLASP